MKKRVISAILCGMMAASLLGTVAFADETKTFTVGFDAEYPPYGYMGDDGEYTGFDLELAQAVCDLEVADNNHQGCAQAIRMVCGEEAYNRQSLE